MIPGRVFHIVFILATVLICQNAMAVERIGTAEPPVPILLYHRFGPTPADSMTVTNQVFLSHLEYLKSNGYNVISLRQLVDCVIRKVPAPARSVAIVADDGHKSIYTDMLPIVRKYRIPVTLFIYPSAISNASYAMSWAQLRELQRSGLFDIQSHTFWHPNFKKEKKRLSAHDYEQFVRMQFVKSKARLEKELGTRIDMLAWPFGIYDDDLMAKAKEAGYIAAFTIESACGEQGENPMKLSRYLLTNAHRGKKFEMIFTGNGCPAAKGGLRK
jgi:peptidoglycan/xylan/chitin deacetylase (PgdA/CDA1 family)